MCTMVIKMSEMQYSKGTLTPLGIDLGDMSEEDINNLWEHDIFILFEEAYKADFDVRNCWKPTIVNVEESSDGRVSFEVYHHAHWTDVVENAILKQEQNHGN